MKLEQLICKHCGEYLGVKNKMTNEVMVEDSVETSFNNELVICPECDSAIALK